MLFSLFVLSACLLAAANTPDLARAGSLTLPPRPTLVPTATPSTSSHFDKGSFIRLAVDTSRIDFWTTIEWHDAHGGWHVVDGWQGTLETDQTKTWWVAEADRGNGPFHWMVYIQRDGQLLGRSQAFYLPTANRQVVSLKVTAAP